MCYDISTLIKKKSVYAKSFGLEESSVEDVQKLIPPVFHTSGFVNPLIPVVSSEQKEVMQAFEWGLIPHWSKDIMTAVKMSKQTLNARIETIKDKPSFRNSAGKQHCWVIVDGFYEYHHVKGKAFPFFIQMEDKVPFALAGLWENWRNDKEGIVKNTVSIVTAPGNSLMTQIHNNPKMEGPRMPLVLNAENQQLWLDLADKSDEPSKDSYLSLFEKDLLELKLRAHPVNKLRGKAYVGNKPEIQEPVQYQELSDLLIKLH
jgi:putative SOS response-associated peptidase YedK